MTVLSTTLDRLRTRPDLVLWGLLGVHLFLKALMFWRSGDAPYNGDEMAYVNGGQALSNAVRDLVGLQSPDGAELGRNVVASGWFMPGMSVVLTPLFVLVPDAPIPVVRAYLAAVVTVLSIVVVLLVRRRLGDAYAIAIAVFPGLATMWILFTLAAWGDLLSGLLIVVLLLLALSVFEDACDGRPPSLATSVRLGLAAISVVYLRSSALTVALALCGAAFLAVVLLLRGRARLTAMARASAGVAVFVALLAPWSVAASHVLGDRVITTTTVPTVMAQTFGDPDRICFGPCDPNSSRWFGPVRYAREVAHATDLSELQALDQMSRYARQDVTPRSYARDVVTGFGRYVANPGQYAKHLPSDSAGTAGYWAMVLSTGVLFYPALLCGIAGLFVLIKDVQRLQILSLLTKLTMVGLLTQPFVHLAGGRYWTTIAPMFALSAVFVWKNVTGGSFDEPDTPVRSSIRRGLMVTQACIVGFVAVVVIGVVSLAVL